MTKPTAVRVAATSARVIAGIAVSAACVAGVIVAVPMAWPTVSQTPAQAEVTPISGDIFLTCAGPLRALGRDPMNAALVSAAAFPDVTVGAADGVRVEEHELRMPELADAGEQTMYVGRSDAREAVEIAAAESVSVMQPDLAGFAASACRAPSMESWIVGGAASTGTSDIVLIANPSDVTATASFTVYGASGPKRTSDIVLAPRTQVSVPLAAGAAGESTPIVRVTATGAPLRTMLQSSLIRVLDPSGVDLQDGTGQPQRAQVLAGVRVLEEATDAASMTIVRLMAPSNDTTVRLTARDAESARVVGDEISVDLRAGEPVEVDLPGLAVGTYSVEIDAEEPVVAAVWQSTGAGAGADFAWMTPAPTITEPTTFAVPRGPEARLHLRNTTEADAVVILTDLANGDQREIPVAADGSALVEVDADTSYGFSTTAPVHAAITMATSGAIAGWPVWPSAASSSAVTVYP